MFLVMLSNNMTMININEAKTHLSRYARRVKNGETIILCDRNHPFAEIRPLSKVEATRPRELGKFQGQCPVPEEFFEADPLIEDYFLK